eukprot:s2423_g5.t1
MNVDANKIVFPTAWEIGRRGTPPVSHMSDYWVPWDEELDSMIEYHLFVADMAVLEHISQIATGSRGYLQLCQEPCFWEECQESDRADVRASLDCVELCDYHQTFRTAFRRDPCQFWTLCRGFEWTVISELQISETYSTFPKSSMPSGIFSRADILFFKLRLCGNIDWSQFVYTAESCKMTHLISDTFFYELHLVLDTIKLPVDLMDIAEWEKLEFDWSL